MKIDQSMKLLSFGATNQKGQVDLYVENLKSKQPSPPSAVRTARRENAAIKVEITRFCKKKTGQKFEINDLWLIKNQIQHSNRGLLSVGQHLYVRTCLFKVLKETLYYEIYSFLAKIMNESKATMKRTAPKLIVS